MKGAIFDVDGTILDSMQTWYYITADFFRSRGIELAHEQNLEYQKMTLEDSLVHIHEKYIPDMSFGEMIAELTSRTKQAYMHTIPLKPGVREYMTALHDSGVKIAVATSGFKELCQSAFKRLGIADLIDAYAFSSEVGCSKDSPDIYLLAAERIGLAPKDCTVYEDIITGIMSAGSAGFYTVAIEDSTNTQDKERLIQHSDRYITGWDELLSKHNDLLP